MSEVLKRDLTKRFECPLCRQSSKGFFKNVVLENIIQKYLVTASDEVKSTRARLTQERQKVIESSQNDPNIERNMNRVHHYNLNESVSNAFMEVLPEDNFPEFPDIFDDTFSDDEDELSNEEEEMDYFNNFDEEDYDSDGDENLWEEYDIAND